MSAVEKVSEIERKLCAKHKSEPYFALLVMQLSNIAKTAIESAEANWPRHDKRPTRGRLPDLFA